MVAACRAVYLRFVHLHKYSNIVDGQKTRNMAVGKWLQDRHDTDDNDGDNDIPNLLV